MIVCSFLFFSICLLIIYFYSTWTERKAKDEMRGMTNAS